MCVHYEKTASLSPKTNELLKNNQLQILEFNIHHLKVGSLDSHNSKTGMTEGRVHEERSIKITQSEEQRRDGKK